MHLYIYMCVFLLLLLFFFKKKKKAFFLFLSRKAIFLPQHWKCHLKFSLEGRIAPEPNDTVYNYKHHLPQVTLGAMFSFSVSVQIRSFASGAEQKASIECILSHPYGHVT